MALVKIHQFNCCDFWWDWGGFYQYHSKHLEKSFSYNYTILLTSESKLMSLHDKERGRLRCGNMSSGTLETCTTYSFSKTMTRWRLETCRLSLRATQISLFALPASQSERGKRSSFLLFTPQSLGGRATKIRLRKNNIERETPESKLFIIMSL